MIGPAEETQLALKLTPQSNYLFENYFFGNHEVKVALKQLCALEKTEFIYLHGEAGVGKTHLLIAVIEAAKKVTHQVMYLSLSELMKTTQPEVLLSLGKIDLLCLDELDAVAGNAKWEEALFHCFNRLTEMQASLLISSRVAPANSNMLLADLRSRLSTGLTYQLSSLNDSEKQTALILQAKSLGVLLSVDVAQYMLRHYTRDMQTLMSFLKKLDRASLQAQHKLTVPFIKRVLGE